MSAVGQETDFNWGMSKKSDMRYTFLILLSVFFAQPWENIQFISTIWLLFDKLIKRALPGQDKIGFMKWIFFAINALARKDVIPNMFKINLIFFVPHHYMLYTFR